MDGNINQLEGIGCQHMSELGGICRAVAIVLVAALSMRSGARLTCKYCAVSRTNLGMGTTALPKSHGLLKRRNMVGNSGASPTPEK